MYTFYSWHYSWLCQHWWYFVNLRSYLFALSIIRRIDTNSFSLQSAHQICHYTYILINSIRYSTLININNTNSSHSNYSWHSRQWNTFKTASSTAVTMFMCGNEMTFQLWHTISKLIIQTWVPFKSSPLLHCMDHETN